MLELWLMMGGIAGAALRVFVSNSQTTLSKQSIGDILIGGAVGLLYPLYPILEFPANASLYQKAGLIFVLSYLSADFVQNVIRKLGGVK